jgi:hypothetical protein
MRGRSGMFVHGMSVTASSFAKRGTMLTIQVESFMHHEISVRYVSNADLPRSCLQASLMSSSLSLKPQ